jgi:predicted exporter
MRSAHETEGEKIDIISTWLRNVEFYFEKPYMAIIIVSVIVAIAILIIYRRGITNMVINVIPYIVTALMPFAWYAVATQHSYEHHWFTFRGTIVSVFALLCMVIRSKRYGDNG